MRTVKSMMWALALTAGAVGSGWAGVDVTPAYSGKQSPSEKNPPTLEVPEALACLCFDQPGVAVDVFAAGIASSGSGTEDAIGGGLGLTGFLNPYLGFSTNVYWWDDGSSQVHSVSGSAILRYPLRKWCVAPYVLGGAGGNFDSVNQWTAHLGGGIEMACPFARCMGLFADAAYTWADKTDDYTLIRVGARVRW